jgi:hypothetical protein
MHPILTRKISPGCLIHRWGAHLRARLCSFVDTFAETGALFLFEKLPSGFTLSCLGEGNRHHDPFKLFSDTHFLSSSYLQVFYPVFCPALCPEYSSTTVPRQGKSVYNVDIIALSSYFMVLDKTYIMLHIVTMACHDIILFIDINILLTVAPGEK